MDNDNNERLSVDLSLIAMFLKMSPEERAALGISDGLIRMSVGLGGCRGPNPRPLFCPPSLLMGAPVAATKSTAVACLLFKTYASQRTPHALRTLPIWRGTVIYLWHLLALLSRLSGSFLTCFISSNHDGWISLPAQGAGHPFPFNRLTSR